MPKARRVRDWSTRICRYGDCNKCVKQGGMCTLHYKKCNGLSSTSYCNEHNCNQLITKCEQHKFHIKNYSSRMCDISICDNVVVRDHVYCDKHLPFVIPERMCNVIDCDNITLSPRYKLCKYHSKNKKYVCNMEGCHEQSLYPRSRYCLGHVGQVDSDGENNELICIKQTFPGNIIKTCDYYQCGCGNCINGAACFDAIVCTNLTLKGCFCRVHGDTLPDDFESRLVQYQLTKKSDTSTKCYARVPNPICAVKGCNHERMHSVSQFCEHHEQDENKIDAFFNKLMEQVSEEETDKCRQCERHKIKSANQCFWCGINYIADMVDFRTDCLRKMHGKEKIIR